jgi:hypothetical protein
MVPTGSIKDLLTWAGSSAGLMVVISLLIERLPGLSSWFAALPVKTKVLIICLVALLLPQIILLLTTVVPDSTWDKLQPVWEAIVVSVSVITWAIGELTHKVDKRLRS